MVATCTRTLQRWRYSDVKSPRVLPPYKPPTVLLLDSLPARKVLAFVPSWFYRKSRGTIWSWLVSKGTYPRINANRVTSVEAFLERGKSKSARSRETKHERSGQDFYVAWHAFTHWNTHDTRHPYRCPAGGFQRSFSTLPFLHALLTVERARLPLAWFSLLIAKRRLSCLSWYFRREEENQRIARVGLFRRLISPTNHIINILLYKRYDWKSDRE